MSEIEDTSDKISNQDIYDTLDSLYIKDEGTTLTVQRHVSSTNPKPEYLSQIGTTYQDVKQRDEGTSLTGQIPISSTNPQPEYLSQTGTTYQDVEKNKSVYQKYGIGKPIRKVIRGKIVND